MVDINICFEAAERKYVHRMSPHKTNEITRRIDFGPRMEEENPPLKVSVATSFFPQNIVNLKTGECEYPSQVVKDLVKIGNYELVEGLYYSKDYFWVKIENGKTRLGITDYAQKQMREIVFLEIPKVGDCISQNEALGTVESVKAVSDLIAPLSGTIEETNEEVRDKPELLNQDPFGKGWILLVTPSNLEEELKNLMDFNKASDWHKEKSKEG